MPFALASVNEVAKFLGLRTLPVPVVGTGSMYPSLFWEESEGGPDNIEQRVVEEYRTTPMMYRRYEGVQVGEHIYLRKEVGIGDMITFQSAATREILEGEDRDANSGFIKRVIALPGDTVELRDGYLYRNSVQVEEPYIHKPRSTYGDVGLPDCRKLTIPVGEYLVLGDNRKTSSDSRGDLGLVKDVDISFLLPYGEQSIYHDLWRDTSRDAELAGTPTLNAKEFYELVNQARTTAALTPLTPKSLLSSSARNKATQVLAGNPDYPLASSLASAGYSNIITGELSIRGRFTAEELLTNILYFDTTRSQLMDPRYTEIGIYDLNQEVDSCPTEVVVTHLGGFVPADYDPDTIASWVALRDNLESVIPSWEKALDNSDINQSDLDSLLTIFRRRLALADEVVAAMNSNEWLSDDLLARIKADDADAALSQELSEKLNN